MGPRRVGGPNLEKVGPEGWGPEGWGPERVGPRKGGAPKGWGPERVGPRKGGGPKISRFFFPFPPPFRCFCVSLEVFSWNFGGETAHFINTKYHPSEDCTTRLNFEHVANGKSQEQQRQEISHWYSLRMYLFVW